MHLRDFELAGKESCVAARQFVSHLDREIYRPGVSDSFVFAERIASAAIFDLPPAAGADLLSLASEFPRNGARRGEIRVNLAATGDWSIDAKSQARYPTKDLEILFVRTQRESCYLDR